MTGKSYIFAKMQIFGKFEQKRGEVKRTSKKVIQYRKIYF